MLECMTEEEQVNVQRNRHEELPNHLVLADLPVLPKGLDHEIWMLEMALMSPRDNITCKNQSNSQLRRTIGS